MDKLAKYGAYGRIERWPTASILEVVANMSMMGYDLPKVYEGRGVNWMPVLA